ncbi:MAG: trehalose-phosphatase [Elusimicrobia bacterium]|nr:trehalose-phosphatase [Elusimicrobiota bacterium]
MKYFFNEWKTIQKKLNNTKKLLVFFDYDGTLTPIVSRPELAKLSLETKKLLTKVSESKKVVLAIVSGRPLKEVKKFIKIKNIIYAGNHGFEIAAHSGVTRHQLRSCGRVETQAGVKTGLPRIYIHPAFARKGWVHPEAKKTRPLLQRIKKVLKKKIGNIKGAFVEDKGLTLTIHWRLTPKKYLSKLFALVRSLICGNLHLKLTRGKKVWEIRPNIDWHKGKAVEYIMSKVQCPKSSVTLYLGDDVTDEDAFKSLGKGISIRIGKLKNSKAKYYLKNQSEINKFLKSLNLLILNSRSEA